MKESSDRDAEILMSVEDEEYSRNGGSTPSNRSNTSLNRLLGQQQNQQGTTVITQRDIKAGSGNEAPKEKRSRLDRFFGRKSSISTNNSNQVTPHPHQQTPSPSLRPLNTLTKHGNSSVTGSNTSATDLSDLRYLPVEEESEEEITCVHGSGVGSSHCRATGTEVKLHPTRAKTFALPKSLRNLKRRIAALRAKGTDLDAEKREREERERANGGVADEKKKFALIRLLPWKSSKKQEISTV